MTFIGIPNPDDGDEADKRAFINGMSTQISHVLDDPGEFWTDFEVASQPTMVFLAADGTLERHTGATDPQALLKRVDELVAKGS